MSGDPSREQAAAREEVMNCEKEIQSIKAALRRLGGAGNADEPNSLEISILKVRLRIWVKTFLVFHSYHFPFYCVSFVFRSKDCQRPPSQCYSCNFPVPLKKEHSAKFMIQRILILSRRGRWLPLRGSKHPTLL